MTKRSATTLLDDSERHAMVAGGSKGAHIVFQSMHQELGKVLCILHFSNGLQGNWDKQSYILAYITSSSFPWHLHHLVVPNRLIFVDSEIPHESCMLSFVYSIFLHVESDTLGGVCKLGKDLEIYEYDWRDDSKASNQSLTWEGSRVLMQNVGRVWWLAGMWEDLQIKYMT